MLSWAIGFFVAASLAAYVAFQAGGSLPDLVQIMMWVLIPVLAFTLLRPIFYRKRVPIIPPLPSLAQPGVRRREPAYPPPRPQPPRGKQHSPGSRTAAFLVNAGIAVLLYTWVNNELKAQRDMDAYAANPPPFSETVTLTGTGFDPHQAGR